MDTLQAIATPMPQGATGLFPISSLGHAVLPPALLEWGLDQESPEFPPFLVRRFHGSGRSALSLLVHRCASVGLSSAACLTLR